MKRPSKRRGPLPVRLFRQHFLADLTLELSVADAQRLEGLLPLFDTQDHRASLADCLALLYPKREPEKAQNSFRAFRSRFGKAAKKAGLDLLFAADTNKRHPLTRRFCWIEGPDLTKEAMAEFFVESISQLERESVIESRAMPATGRSLEEGKTPVSVFASYVDEDAAAAKDLLARLRKHLAGSKRFVYDLWSPDLLLPGEDREQRIEETRSDSFLELILSSPDHMASDSPMAHRPDRHPQKPVVPVDLKEVSKFAERRGLEAKQPYRYTRKAGTGKSFVDCAANEKDAFVLGLFERIEERLGQLFEERDQPPGRGKLRRDHESRDPIELARDLVPRLSGPYVDGSALATGLDLDDIEKLAKSDSAGQGRKALDLIREWLADPDGPPYFAVLGEYGMGKTTTLMQLTHWLLEERETHPDLPLPIFIDLKTYSDTIREGKTPTLEKLLEEFLERAWKADAPRFTTEDIVRMVREEGALIIFDGLDERLVHLDDYQARQFIRELWRVMPAFRVPGDGKSKRRPATRETTKAKPGRMILSCRSHYFKTIRDQNSMLTGERRDGVKAADYRACILLPFNEEQVREYLAASENVGPDRVEAVLELFSSLHNLDDLSRRPFLLSLITEQIERLERKRAQGEPVRAVTLYDEMAREWLNRDDGKHHLLPEDKLVLMEDIAAAMWRQGAREWTWEQVHEWFGQRWYEDGALQARYLNPAQSAKAVFGLLEEDFRTATFVLRPDTSLERFRFAHTSMQEYFLARHLFRALRRNLSELWDLPVPSPESLDFLGDLLDIESDGPRLLDCLSDWLGNYRPRVSEAAFRYWLRSVERDLPQPRPSRVDLHGANLENWSIRGPVSSPLNLRGANLSGAVLTGARFENVDLSQADLSRVSAWRAEFLGVRLEGARLENANLLATTWRGCDAGKLECSGADWRNAVWIRSRVDFPERGRYEVEGLVFSSCDGSHGKAESQPTVEREAVKLANLFGHAHSVHACAWSPDGRRLVSGSYDSTLKVWDATSGRALLSLEGHWGGVEACAWSPDGRRLVSGSNDSTLKVWDAASGRALLSLEGHGGGVWACAWSPDGRHLVSGSNDSTLKVWDAASGRALLSLEGHRGGVWACAWSPDGRHLVSGSNDSTLKVWDAASGRALLSLEGHRGAVWACAWSPDGRRLVSGSGDDTLKVWDADSGSALMSLEGHRASVLACAWSPDGRRLVSGSADSTLRMWDAESGSALMSLEGHRGAVRACAWSPDGRRLVSDDSALKVWDADSGRVLLSLEKHRSGVWACAWSPDGRRLVSGSVDSTVRVWDAASGRALLSLEGHRGAVFACAWSPDGRCLVSGSVDSTVRVWDAASGRALLSLEGHRGAVSACAWSPDGRRFVSGSADSTLKVWDAASGVALLSLEGHEDAVSACAWSPDGPRLVSGAHDSTLKVWDASSGVALLSLEGHRDSVRACAWSPDGRRLVSASNDSTLKVWDATSGRNLLSLEGHQSFVFACAWSPDGRRLVSASHDSTLKVWDATSGEIILSLEGHRGSVWACAWSPDGRCLASGSLCSTLKVWDSQDGRLLYTILNGPRGRTASVDFEGNRVLWAGPEAWRGLGWLWTDPKTQSVRPLPAEHFGPLPED